MKSVPFWALALLVVGLIAVAQGCSLDEIITVDVPRDVQKTMGVGDTVTLREARTLREELIEKNNAAVRKFDTEIADGALAEELGKSAINDVLPIAVPALGTLPGGTILTGLLVGVAGLMTRKPGDGKKLKEAEDKGYDMGRAELLDSLAKAGK